MSLAHMKYGEIGNHSLFASLKKEINETLKLIKKVNPFNLYKNASNEVISVSIFQHEGAVGAEVSDWCVFVS